MADHLPSHASTQRVRSIVVTPRDGGQPFLILEIEVDCAVCGGFTAEIAGHHLRALGEAITEVVGENPSLCGEPMDQNRKQRTEWQGTAPGPGKASLN